jgi:hypothetical protein
MPTRKSCVPARVERSVDASMRRCVDCVDIAPDTWDEETSRMISYREAAQAIAARAADSAS